MYHIYDGWHENKKKHDTGYLEVLSAMIKNGLVVLEKSVWKLTLSNTKKVMAMIMHFLISWQHNFVHIV